MDVPTASAPQGPGLIESLWRYRLWLLLAAVVCGAGGYGLSLLQPTMYEAEARLILGDPRGSGIFVDSGRAAVDPERRLAKQTERVTSRDVLEGAAQRLDGAVTVEQLREGVSAEDHRDLVAIVLKARSPSAERAVAMADAVGEAYQEVIAQEIRDTAQVAIVELDQARIEARAQLADLQRRLDENPDDSTIRAELEVASQQLMSVSNRMQQIAVEAALFGSGVELFEPAELPEGPYQPRPRRTAAAAAVLGLFAAGALAWWRAEYTQVADSADDVHQILDAPLLGEVPVLHGGSSDERPLLHMLNASEAESYQFIVTSLLFTIAELGGTSVAVTSAAPGDGKTVTAINLALAAAQDGRRVVLLDGDERVRALSAEFGFEGHRGLTDLVEDHLPLSACKETVRLPNSTRDLVVVPAGSRINEVSGFFRKPQFRRAMTAIKKDADLLVIDTPPLLAVSDVLQIATHADGVVLVVNRGMPLSRVRHAKERLELSGTPLLGYVFNQSKSRGGEAYGTYYAPRSPVAKAKGWSEAAG